VTSPGQRRRLEWTADPSTALSPGFPVGFSGISELDAVFRKEGAHVAVLAPRVGNPGLPLALPLSSRPERTRISCCAAAACAAFRKESRMKLAEPTKFNRKSGGAQWRDLRFQQFVQLH
jgi:hypothetical protein